MRVNNQVRGGIDSLRADLGIGSWIQCRLPDWPRIWEACRRRTGAWPVPPRWSRRDWREELEAEGIAAACTAIHNYDESLGPTLGGHVYHQVLSSALRRYQEECGDVVCRHLNGGGQQAPSPSGEEL